MTSSSSVTQSSSEVFATYSRHTRCLTCDEVYGRWFGAGMVWISGVLEHNEVITEHVHLHIKLVSRITHNDKEDPLTSVFAPGLDSPVPEADGWMWMQFTHEQGRKEKNNLSSLLCSCYPFTKHLSMILCDTLEFKNMRRSSVSLHFCLPGVLYNTEKECLDASPDKLLICTS